MGMAIKCDVFTISDRREKYNQIKKEGGHHFDAPFWSVSIKYYIPGLLQSLLRWQRYPATPVR